MINHNSFRLKNDSQKRFSYYDYVISTKIIFLYFLL